MTDNADSGRPSASDLTELVDTLDRDARAGKLTLGEIVASLQGRGFGPLLLAPALIAVMPTGAIPGVPSACALLIWLIGVQLVAGRRHPWMPRRLRQVRLDPHKLERSLAWVRPVTRAVDRVIHPRLVMLTHPPAPRLIAALCLLLALTIFPLELLPFAAAVPALVIALLGLALSAYDGALVLAALLLPIVGLILL